MDARRWYGGEGPNGAVHRLWKAYFSNVLFGKTPYLRQGSSRFFFGLPNVLAQRVRRTCTSFPAHTVEQNCRSPCGFVKKYLRSFPIRELVDAAVRQRTLGSHAMSPPSDHVNPSSDQLWCVFHQSFRP